MNYMSPLSDSAKHCDSLKLSLAESKDKIFYMSPAQKVAGGGKLTITLTNDHWSRDEAVALINRRYAWRGYGSDHKLSGRQYETTFTARQNGLLIGTITLCTDSTRGLDIENTFPDELRFLRCNDVIRPCELKRLAMECSNHSQTALASLFHFVFIYGTTYDLGTDLFIEVNPRHSLFYEKMLGFRRVSKIKHNNLVNAPSQLMHLSTTDIDKFIKENVNGPNSRLLYRHFFDDEAAHKIKCDLQRMHSPQSI